MLEHMLCRIRICKKKRQTVEYTEAAVATECLLLLTVPLNYNCLYQISCLCLCLFRPAVLSFFTYYHRADLATLVVWNCSFPSWHFFSSFFCGVVPKPSILYGKIVHFFVEGARSVISLEKFFFPFVPFPSHLTVAMTSKLTPPYQHQFLIGSWSKTIKKIILYCLLTF
jgi:hypothetical protein